MASRALRKSRITHRVLVDKRPDNLGPFLFQIRLACVSLTCDVARRRQLIGGCMKAVIYFCVGRDDQRMRLVVDESGPKNVEVLSRDFMGEISWRPADAMSAHREAVLARAVLVSQMTPLQRIENPQMLHPAGITYTGVPHERVEIELGRIRIEVRP